MSKLMYSHSTYSGKSTINGSFSPAAAYEEENHTLFAVDDNGDAIRVGTARIYKVFCSLAESLDITLRNLFDSTQDFYDIFHELCTSEWSDEGLHFESWDEALVTLPVIILDRLQIESSYRGKGLGSQFISHLKETTSYRGEAILALNAQPFEIEASKVHSDECLTRERERERLIRLYTALGFRQVSENSSVMYVLSS